MPRTLLKHISRQAVNLIYYSISAAKVWFLINNRNRKPVLVRGETMFPAPCGSPLITLTYFPNIESSIRTTWQPSRAPINSSVVFRRTKSFTIIIPCPLSPTCTLFVTPFVTMLSPVHFRSILIKTCYRFVTVCSGKSSSGQLVRIRNSCFDQFLLATRSG